MLERLVGGAILLVALLAVLPLLLTREGLPPEPALVQLPAVAGSGEMRTHVITPERGTAEPPVPQHLPPPEPAGPPAGEEPGAASLPAAPPPAAASASPPVAAPPAEATPPATAPSPPTPPSTPAAPPAPAAAEAPASGWVVQLGSFRSQVNADQLAARVREEQFAAYVTPLRTDDGTLYRVRVGPAARERSQAQTLAARLQQAGYPGQLTRQEP